MKHHAIVLYYNITIYLTMCYLCYYAIVLIATMIINSILLLFLSLTEYHAILLLYHVIQFNMTSSTPGHAHVHGKRMNA